MSDRRDELDRDTVMANAAERYCKQYRSDKAVEQIRQSRPESVGYLMTPKLDAV